MQCLIVVFSDHTHLLFIGTMGFVMLCECDIHISWLGTKVIKTISSSTQLSMINATSENSLDF